ncbi:MAG: LPS assembly lipoprotein LptE [Phycisphaerales bacterium]
MRRRTLLALLCLAPLTACASDPKSGYAWSSSFDTSIHSVAAPMWENETFHHGLEARITESLVKEIQRATPWRVVPVGEADTTLTGTLRRVEIRRLSTARVSGLAEELSVELTIDYTWKNGRTGKTLAARKGMRVVESFVPALGVGERVEIGETAAVDAAARAVVASMRSGW